MGSSQMDAKMKANQNGKKGYGSRLKSSFLHLDLFREQFLIRLDYEGNFRHKTALGSIFSILLFIFIVFFTA